MGRHSVPLIKWWPCGLKGENPTKRTTSARARRNGHFPSACLHSGSTKATGIGQRHGSPTEDCYDKAPRPPPPIFITFGPSGQVGLGSGLRRESWSSKPSAQGPNLFIDHIGDRGQGKMVVQDRVGNDFVLAGVVETSFRFTAEPASAATFSGLWVGEEKGFFSPASPRALKVVLQAPA